MTHHKWWDCREGSRSIPAQSIKINRSTVTLLQIPKSTAHKVLHKRLRLYAYKVYLLQVLLPTNKQKRAKFAIEMLHRISDDKGFLQMVCFTD